MLDTAEERDRDVRKLCFWLTAAIALLILTVPALSDTYPVSGKWTYDDPGGDGPAKQCGKRFMSFDGNQRRDTGGSVPGYLNLTVEQTGSSNYRITDAFNTGQINARATYTLRVVDKDRIELSLTGGKTVALRRCE